jgi:hypothetical protein
MFECVCTQSMRGDSYYSETWNLQFCHSADVPLMSLVLTCPVARDGSKRRQCIVYAETAVLSDHGSQSSDLIVQLAPCKHITVKVGSTLVLGKPSAKLRVTFDFRSLYSYWTTMADGAVRFVSSHLSIQGRSLLTDHYTEVGNLCKNMIFLHYTIVLSKFTPG